MKYLIIFLILVNSLNSFSQKRAATVIKMNKTGGVYEMECLINGLPLTFIFDTGASSISMSLKEAQKLIELGLLKSTDVIGKEYYTIADGSIQEGFVVLLKEVQIKDIKLKNVKAGISSNYYSPLLLGQSALEKLGKFSFDYSKSELTIEGVKEYDFLENNKLNQNPKLNYLTYKNEYLSDEGLIGKWIADEKVEIYQDYDALEVIGYINKGEKFYAIESQYHYYKLAYARITNVLKNDFPECHAPPFRIGDVIYFLNAEGEGVWNVIHNNKHTYISCSLDIDNMKLERSYYDGCNNIEGIILDAKEEFIYWVRIKTLDGKIGWIKNPNCLNVIGVRPNCYNNPSPAW